MDEIAFLQAQLAAVQQQESALKLSDHNVIDLLQKLQQLGKIQVVFTLTGKQIVTPKQIEREIEDHVTLHAGRLSVSELQQLLSIDRSYVERYVAQVAKAHRNANGPNASQYFVVNNGEEVVTNWYLDAIMEDTNTLLQESGTVTIGELAQQYGFAVEYMKDVVMSRIGSMLKAQERGNVLYTDSFVESQKAQVRGVFTAMTRPTFVPDIIRSYKFDEKVVETYLPELIQTRVLMGTLRGREYVPFVFIEAQRESMYSFFQQNGYLDHARANQLQVARPFDFLKKRFADAIALKDCVVSHALQLQIEGSVEVAVHDAAFVDVRSILPSAIPVADMALLLSKSEFLARGSSGGAIQIGDVYAVSRAFLTACLELFKKDASSKALRASAQQRTMNVVEQRDVGGDVDDDDDDEDDGNAKRAGKKGKKGNAKSASVVDDAPATEGKKGKRGKAVKAEETKSSKSKSKRGKKGGDDEPSSGRRGGTGTEAAVSITPSRDEIVEMIAGAFDHAADDDELLQGLADHLEPEVESIYSSALATALSSIMRGDAASLRELRKRFEDRFDELYALLTIYEKGFNKLSLHVDAKDKTALDQLQCIESHLLESIGVEIASLVTSFVAASNNLEMEDVPPFTVDTASEETASTVTVMTSLSDENKRELEKSLASSTSSALVRLWTFATAGRRALGDYMMHLPVVASALSMPLRKIDRKRERQIIFAYRHSVIGALEQVEDEQYAHIAALLMQLLFQQCTALPISLPQSNVGAATLVVRAFESTLPVDAVSVFHAFTDVAMRLSSGVDDNDDDVTTRWKELVETVRTLVVAKDMNAASG